MFYYKRPDESKLFTVSFADAILSSETIQSGGITVSVTNLATDGNSTSDMYISGSLSTANSAVSFRLTAGDDDTVYKLIVSTGGVTTSGNIYAKTCYLYSSYESQYLVSLDEMKEYLSITSTSYDAVLLSTLRSACDYVKKHTGRDFIYSKYTDTIYLEDKSDQLLLDNFPLDEVVSITIDGTLIDSTFGGYVSYVGDKEGVIRRVDGSCFPAAPVPVTVVYRAGFKSIPEDIKLVVKKLVSSDYNTRLQNGILSEALGSYKVVYDRSSVLTEDSQIRDILTKYTKRLL